ncbi:Leukotriene C4 synthase [Lonchura striata]|uniref:Leukotriene C4 synthase n=1 Tax=Lonchura striata TaxID=40157 RepID=A0A218V0E8_9PASE|nr:Leukotriene C4 synthase [Lonchura striata domestica]
MAALENHVVWRQLRCGGGNTYAQRQLLEVGGGRRVLEQLYPAHQAGVCSTVSSMRDQIDLLATVTVLGVLEQAYFAMQVIYARRKYKISPPGTTGHPEFERTFRAHWIEKCLNSSWEQLSPLLPGGGTGSPYSFAGAWLFPRAAPLGQGVTAACGLLYLYTRLRYFQGYAVAAQGRLGPLYASAWLLWVLVGLALAGLLAHFLRPSSSTWMAALVWPLQLCGAW